MNGMFRSAFTYNQPLSSWDTSSVTRMDYMFQSVSTYNQPLSSWDTSSVATMTSMFASASSYNQGELPSCELESDAYFSFVISLLPTLQESLSHRHLSFASRRSQSLANIPFYQHKPHVRQSMRYGAQKLATAPRPRARLHPREGLQYLSQLPSKRRSLP